jgi:MOSC domain-containing protein YiiM
MEIIATNKGTPTPFLWNGKEEQTGIFKYPVNESLFLGTTEVLTDTIIDRKHHGGLNKACYLFSADHYPYWKGLYPELEWNWGMFGENLTIAGLDESVMRIGDIYTIGTALVQISQPREPCYKLGVRFGNQAVLKQFIEFGHPGTYVRILQEGSVKKGDRVRMTTQSVNALTVKQVFQLLVGREKNTELLRLAIENLALPEYKREQLKKYLQSNSKK